MAAQRPAHRRGTTSRDYRRAQAIVFRQTVCARCGNSKGPIVRQRCSPDQHPHHALLKYCPTHPLAPSLGHRQDLQFGGSVLSRSNHQLEHYGCNASAGSRARWAAAKGRRGAAERQSWDW